MSETTDKDAKPAKKGKGLMIGVLALAMLGIGGGGAYGMIAAGIIGGSHKEDNEPKLIRKGETDPYAPKADGKDGDNVTVEATGPGGSVYRTAYYTFPDDFTSNLKGSDALLQVGLAAATRRDGRVLAWIKDNELAIRSAMLMVIADTPEGDINTLAGKQRLQQRLTAAVNQVLVQREGFGGVDNVFFKTFIVQ